MADPADPRGLSAVPSCASVAPRSGSEAKQGSREEQPVTDEDTMGADVTLVRFAAHSRDPSQAVQHVLILTDGPPGTELPRRLPLGGAGVRVGRVATGNDLVLPAPEVSRSHCTVSLVAGRAILADLGST